jgi:hypothetical protein
VTLGAEGWKQDELAASDRQVRASGASFTGAAWRDRTDARTIVSFMMIVGIGKIAFDQVLINNYGHGVSRADGEIAFQRFPSCA